jgi:hypothetical protein
MALKKRCKTWHPHFFVDGQRFRQSLETSDWREAQAKEKVLISAASQGKLSASSEDFARLIFEDALEKYLLAAYPSLPSRAGRKSSNFIVKLKEYFRGRRLRTTEADDVIAYRQWRVGQGSARRW